MWYGAPPAPKRRAAVTIPPTRVSATPNNTKADLRSVLSAEPDNIPFATNIATPATNNKSGTATVLRRFSMTPQGKAHNASRISYLDIFQSVELKKRFRKKYRIETELCRQTYVGINGVRNGNG